MAYVPVTGVYFPAIPNVNLFLGGTAFSAYLLNAANQKLAMIFRAPATGTLDHIEFFTGTVTVGGTLKCSFQSVSATTGDPSGTVDQYTTQTILDIEDNAWETVGQMTSTGAGGGSRRSVTKGELVAAVLEFNSFAGTESLNIQGLRTVSGLEGAAQNYTDVYNGTIWTKNSLTQAFFLIVYDSGVVYNIPGCGITDSTTSSALFNLNTSPDEVGGLISIPFQCKVDGMYVCGNLAGDSDIVLYDGTTAIATVNVDKDQRVNNFSSIFICPFAELTLTPGNAYRIIMKALTTTNCSITYIHVNATSHLAQYSGSNQIGYTARTDGGAWIPTANRVLACGFRISALSDVVTAGGGGGGLVASRARLLGGM